MKKKFIVYTGEGGVLTPEGDEIENPLILGWSDGYDEAHAIECLFDDNGDFEACGFTRAEAVAQEVV